MKDYFSFDIALGYEGKLLTVLYTINDHIVSDRDGNILSFSAIIPFMVSGLNTEYISALNNLAK